MRQMLRLALEGYGLLVYEAATCGTGMAQVATQNPDVILLAMNLPDGSAIEQLEKIRSWSNVPVIVLSPTTELSSKLKAFESGANDFVTKPFSAPELVARIRVQLRHRHRPHPPEVLRFGPNQIDFGTLIVTRDGQEVNLSAKELSLLLLVARSPERVVTYRTILSEIWGEGAEGQIQYLYVYIRRLRAKFEREPSRPRYILTEPGVGVRLNITGSLTAAMQAKYAHSSARLASVLPETASPVFAEHAAEHAAGPTRTSRVCKSLLGPPEEDQLGRAARWQRP
jgi:two-component system KDP operon response regulator KdpE